MPAISDLDSLLTSRMHTLRCELKALRAQAAVHDRLLYQVILPAMTRHGPPSSSDPSPYPTPGTPSSAPSSSRIARTVKGLGEWVRPLSAIAGALKAISLITPWLILAATAAWKWALPYLSRLVPGF